MWKKKVRQSFFFRFIFSIRYLILGFVLGIGLGIPVNVFLVTQSAKEVQAFVLSTYLAPYADTVEITYVGYQPDPEFVAKVEQIRSRVPTQSVLWDGVITFTRGTPFGGRVIKDKWGFDFVGAHLYLKDITIYLDMGRTIQLLTIEKELLGTALASTWILNNPDFIDWHHPESFVFGDGLAFLAVQDSYNEAFTTSFLSWSPTEVPTCAHLLKINRYSEAGQINSGGIGRLLEEKGCN